MIVLYYLGIITLKTNQKKLDKGSLFFRKTLIKILVKVLLKTLATGVIYLDNL